MLEPIEPRVGSALFLDPEALRENGATPSCSPEREVQGRHYFVCLAVGADGGSEWAPLFSEDGPGRIEVARQARGGHPGWVDKACFFHPGQVWTCNVAALTSAAAGDLSLQPGREPNTLDVTTAEELHNHA